MLEDAGHDASTILEQNMGGEPDPDIASACLREHPALVTLDLGFADVRTYPPEQYPGLVVLRLRRQDKPHILEILERLLPTLQIESLEGWLWVVEEERVRIRA